MMATSARQQHESVVALAEDFAGRLEFLDAALLLGLVRSAPEELARALAASMVAVAETEGLAEECTGRADVN